MSLDPLTNRIQREQAAAQAAIPPSLEPDFPYTRTPFDPFLFGLDMALPESEPSSTLENTS